MAHFAHLDKNNTVTHVIVINNDELLDENGIEQESKGTAFCQSHYGGNWIQTSYNEAFRRNYASIGSQYIPEADIFTLPKPYASWVLDSNYEWQAPVEYPLDGKLYVWDENTIAWTEVLNN